eukprot:TRINITY_DN8205_c0_g3_i1.p1 TRINITY_DN8205_c0_g3~~TRINITY_DN8205_c0_g3_i1.p1  ORF type:complete len:488 (+),score=162.43 TRINITY_DN8205_c0_g3_i1:69-1466(+)
MAAARRSVLLAALLCGASSTLLPDLHCQRARGCDVARPATCDTLACKRPHVPPAAVRHKTVTSGLPPADKAAFEHGLAAALRKTDAVRWVTQALALVVQELLVGVAGLLGQDVAVVMREAFYANPAAHGGAPQGSPHNTGYVGPGFDEIMAVLEGGNLRETWGLLYILTHTEYLTSVLQKGLHDLKWSNETLATLGLDPEAVWTRAALVRASNGSYNGMPTFLAPTFDSWVRFDFPGPDEAAPQWAPARVSRLPHAPWCETAGLLSNSSAIQPPLSERERAYQCGKAPVCTLQWYPGRLCYNVTDAPLRGAAARPDAAAGPGFAGFAARAAALGYRTVAGPSGTTANMLQLARLVGFGPSALALTRLAMVAWLVGTDDHSLYEVLLGAEPHMTDEFSMAEGLEDLGRLMPADATVHNGGAAMITFPRLPVWTAVVTEWLGGRPEGKRLFGALDKEQQAYLRSLVA